MKEFSKRAINVLNNISHQVSAPMNHIDSAHEYWQYQIEPTGSDNKSFKILTLKYCYNSDNTSPIELLILESFSLLIESRDLVQVFNLSFKELESFLRDFNTSPSIPSHLLDQAFSKFEAVKLDFLVFLLINEVSGKNLINQVTFSWSGSTLSEKVNLVKDALEFSHKYYGNLMPSRLISITTSEVIVSYPEKYLPVSELVLDHFLKSFGVTAGLKLVAV